MAIVYYTRHGQTVWNVANKICGATDVELTDLGRAQAKELGEKIKVENIKIDEITVQPEKTYLLVAHNGISRMINSYFNDMTNEEFAGFGIRNCQLIKYQF